MRHIKRTLAVLAPVASAAVLTVSPASAGTNWREVHTNSNWTCGKTVAHQNAREVYFQTCIVLNANYDEQAVLVVVNDGPSAISLSGTVFTTFGGDTDCNGSVLSPGYRRGCFGPTKHAYTGNNSAYSELVVNGQNQHDEGAAINL